jgi:hypothetical protein
MKTIKISSQEKNVGVKANLVSLNTTRVSEATYSAISALVEIEITARAKARAESLRDKAISLAIQELTPVKAAKKAVSFKPSVKNVDKHIWLLDKPVKASRDVNTLLRVNKSFVLEDKAKEEAAYAKIGGKVLKEIAFKERVERLTASVKAKAEIIKEKTVGIKSVEEAKSLGLKTLKQARVILSKGVEKYTEFTVQLILKNEVAREKEIKRNKQIALTIAKAKNTGLTSSDEMAYFAKVFA